VGGFPVQAVLPNVHTDCLLQWSASIAEEDGSNRTVVAVAGCDVIMKLTASGPALLFCPGLARRRIQRSIVGLKEHPDIRSFEILTAVSAAVTIFRNMKPCNLVNRQGYSGGTRHLLAC